MGLFKTKNVDKKSDSFIQAEKTMFEKIVFDNLESDNDNNLTSLADKMMNGNPLIINLELLDIDQANKVVAFLSGVIYAINGEIVNVKEKVFMFANSEVYQDGTIEEFLKEIVE